ncbi:hypothetical protein H4R34_002255 [Dimargaris verticillata]|uniref:WH1 domain-containing protein n=1 Tax=Dimargaris verticillata TaxID=2761393 RepID=A0A9W8B2W6_9FUNG|nr:hypothetical protein H4R34_002255 [Dimargaris verticillata]
MTKQNHRPGSLPAARQSKANVNLQVLRRHDRSVTRIVDLASHVVIYRFNHAKNEWEKQGVEGTLFIYERTQVPHYSFMVMNRLSLDNFCIAIKPSLEILVTPQFIIYRESVQAPAVTESGKVSDYDDHADDESIDSCEQYVYSSTGELVPAKQPRKTKPNSKQPIRHQTAAHVAVKQDGKKDAAPIHAIWVYDAADRKRIADTLSSLRTAPPPTVAAAATTTTKANQPGTLLEDMLQRARGQAAAGGEAHSRPQSRAEHLRQGHHVPSSDPVAPKAPNHHPSAAGKSNTKGPNLLNQFFPGLCQASPEPSSTAKPEKAGPFANTNDLLSALSHSVARPSQPSTATDHATAATSVAGTARTLPPTPTKQSVVVESATTASPQPPGLVPPATSHLPMPIPIPMAGMPAFGPPPTHPMHMPVPVFFPGPMPTAPTDVGGIGPDGYGPMMPWPANPMDTVQSTLPGRIAQDTVAKAQQLHATDTASAPNDNDSITDSALLSQDEFEIQLLHTLQTDPALMQVLYQQYCQAVHFLTNPLPGGMMSTVGGAPGMPPMFPASIGNDSHTNSTHDNSNGPTGGALLPIPGPFLGQYGGPFPPPPPLHMLPVFGNHDHASPLSQPGGMSIGPNGFILPFPQPLPPQGIVSMGPTAAAAANSNHISPSEANLGSAVIGGGNATTGTQFSQPPPQQNQPSALPTQHGLPPGFSSAPPATAHSTTGSLNKPSARATKASVGAARDGGNQLLVDQIIRLGGAVQSQ